MDVGSHQLTTTRVAERAGVSVGTMYQYFPHKQALIYALNERYLEALAERIEVACAKHHGVPVAEGVEALIDVYWRAKTERADVTRALYRSVADMDNQTLIDAFATRTDTATTAMLSSASDASFADVASVNRTLVTVIFGAVRHAFERGLSGPTAEDLHRQLVAMCLAYLQETDRRA
ncbi:AcrR family transcriptional regulator [Phyllobacterium ifriqiyense]